MFIKIDKNKLYWLDVDNIYMNCYRPFNSLHDLKAFSIFAYGKGYLRLFELKAIEQEINEINQL